MSTSVKSPTASQGSPRQCSSKVLRAKPRTAQPNPQHSDDMQRGQTRPSYPSKHHTPREDEAPKGQTRVDAAHCHLVATKLQVVERRHRPCSAPPKQQQMIKGRAKPHVREPQRKPQLGREQAGDVANHERSQQDQLKLFYQHTKHYIIQCRCSHKLAFCMGKKEVPVQN